MPFRRDPLAPTNPTPNFDQTLLVISKPMDSSYLMDSEALTAWELVARHLSAAPTVTDLRTFLDLGLLCADLHRMLKQGEFFKRAFQNAFMARWGPAALPLEEPFPSLDWFVDEFEESLTWWPTKVPLYYNKQFPQRQIEAALYHWFEGNGGPYGAVYVVPSHLRSLMSVDGGNGIWSHLREIVADQTSQMPGDFEDPDPPEDYKSYANDPGLDVSSIFIDVGRLRALTVQEAYDYVSGMPADGCSYGKPMKEELSDGAVISTLSALVGSVKAEIDVLRSKMDSFKWFTFDSDTLPPYDGGMFYHNSHYNGCAKLIVSMDEVSGHLAILGANGNS
jgi:hypothetical protein